MNEFGHHIFSSCIGMCIVHATQPNNFTCITHEHAARAQPVIAMHVRH